MSSTSFEPVNEAVRAGAGAGKTQALSQRTVALAAYHLKKFGKLPRIVVTTFTKKATEELRERITTEIFKQERFDLLDLVSSKQHLHISTIHGVLSVFLRRFGHLIGLESGFRVVDDEALRRLAKKEIKSLIDSGFGELEIWDRLTLDEAVTMLLQFYSYSIEYPDLKFFNADDHWQTYKNLVWPSVEELRRTALEIQNSTSNEKWRDYAQSIQGLLREHAATPEQTNLSALVDAVKDLGRKPSYTTKNPPFDEALNESLKDALEKIGKWASEPQYDPKNFKLMHEFAEQVEAMGQTFAEKFLAQKFRIGQLSSGDLELATLKTLRQEPSLGRLFAADWDYWLVDEYQDTSPLQVEILKHLRGDQNLFLVGDPQQSIYLFRGARVEVFEQGLQEMREGGGQVSELRVNYRSTPELLSCINDLIEEMGPEFTPMDPKGPVTKPEDIVLTVRVSEAKNESPFSSIAEFIQEGIQRGEKFGNFCVLARTNDLLVQVAQYLESVGFPTAVHSATGFFRRREVLDAVSILKFLVNPHDNLNLIRLLRSPWYHLEDAVLIPALQGRGSSHWISLCKSLPENPIVMKLKHLLEQAATHGAYEVLVSAVTECGLVDVSHWHDPTGRRESNLWKLITMLREEQRKPGFNFAGFFRRVERAWYDGEDDADASPANEPNRVNLMTIHKSKGLKFAHVILPRMDKVPQKSSSKAHDISFVFDEDMSKWSARVPVGAEDSKRHGPAGMVALSKLDQREIEEHRRLLYVAMTRAQNSLMFHAEPKRDGSFSEGSWASLFSVFKQASAEPQTLRRSHYSVSVGVAPSEFQLKRPSQTQDRAVRPLYQAAKADAVRPSRVSVSRLLEDNVEIPSLMAGTSNIESIERLVKAPGTGTILHRVFESLKVSPEMDIEGELESWLGDQAPVYAEGIRRLLESRDPDLRTILKNGEVEWGFQVQTKRGIVEGQIDLWGIWEDAVWVIDYKSGSPEHIQKAYRQLQLYAFALHKMFGYKKFKLAVVYPRTQRVDVQEFTDLDSIPRQYQL